MVTDGDAEGPRWPPPQLGRHTMLPSMVTSRVTSQGLPPTPPRPTPGETALPQSVRKRPGLGGEAAGRSRELSGRVDTWKDVPGPERKLGEVRVNRPPPRPATGHTASLRNQVWKGRWRLYPQGSQALRGFSMARGSLCQRWVIRGLRTPFSSGTQALTARP